MNFIWDLDGTLFDSYAVINRALAQTLESLNIERDLEAAGVYIIRHSVKEYFAELSEQTGISENALNAAFAPFHDALTDGITLMPCAAEILIALRNRGDRHFVATHRSETAFRALDNLGIRDLFTDIITSRDGFARKPAPDSVNHIIKKHSLDRNETFYVGDRALDIECAANAGIGSVLYLPETSHAEKTGLETFTVASLAEIPGLFEDKRR